MKSIFRFAVWSNVFYLAPLIAAANFELWGIAALLGALVIFSTAFHYSHEVSYVLADKLIALAVIFADVALLALGGFSIFYTVLVGAFLALSLYVRYVQEKGNRKGFYHGVWHLCASFVTLLCILSYAT
ncbi:hypothetical protein HY971_04775 [Candidatus Kaiserbacteria bacterium]|nr:hypothetical protein [Candidatus Kaiserbacteria bacterium]